MDRAARTQGLNLKAERLLKIKLPESNQRQNVFDVYWATSGAVERLALIDFFLRDLQDSSEVAARGAGDERLIVNCVAAAHELDRILVEGGSTWKTTFKPYWGLVRRISETTQAFADLASSPGTDAARKIASAWNACYRHNPDYDRAYRDAVLAVEAVALPVVAPRNKRGTLGNVVSHIADTSAKWTVGGTDTEQQTSGQTLLSMLRTVWHNQQRHAQSDGTILDVTRDEAETAVTLAVTLVHWFSSGLVKRTGA
jgi:hypothetical protein